MRKTILACAMLGALTAEAQDKPNIILIMADDLGWGDTGYNGNPVIRTPFLDQMAKEGIRFNRFYSACAVSSPTRASVLTGRNPYRMGIFTANNGILRPEEISLPELLSEEGYKSGHFGKWHLGTLTYTENDANRGRPGNLKEFNPPALHGYTSAFVTESKVPTWDPMKKPTGRFAQAGWDYLAEGEAYETYGTAYWDINGNKVTDNLDGDDSRVIMDRVIPFIESSITRNEPFLAVVWFHAPHMPFVAGPEYRAMYKDQDNSMQNYAGCITAMDEQIGRLRKFLEEKRADSNTIIWFCSDNGPEDGSPGSSGGFRERKRSLHEGGVRVPGLMVWPQKIQKGISTDIPCITSDILPTIVDLLNIEKSKIPNKLDGISLLPLLNGKMKERPSPVGFCFGDQVSWSDNRYKLYARKGSFELYDIVKDPYEMMRIENDEDSLNNKMQLELSDFIASCFSSFKGDEYGTVSYSKLNQKWVDPIDPGLIKENINLPKQKLNSSSYHNIRGGLKNSLIRFEREKKGRVAFLGGSITFNGGWRDSICSYLQNRFSETEFEFIAAGIPSMGSTPAAFRLQRDVLSSGPIDLLFEEAAVNDGSNTRTTDEQIRAMEGIVRHLRKACPASDIVIMHFVDPDKMESYRSGKIPEVIKNHEKVAQYYNIPTINLAKEVTDRIDAGEFNWEDDFKNLHPSPFGQGIYAHSMVNFLETMWSGKVSGDDKILDYQMPQKLDEACYDNGVLISVEKTMALRGWSYDNNWKPTDGAGTRTNYVNVPMLIGEYPGKTLKYKFEGTAVGIAVAAGPDAGVIEYSIDGGGWEKKDLFTRWSSGLHLPWYLTLQAAMAPGKHVLKLRLANEKNSGSNGYYCRLRYFFVNE